MSYLHACNIMATVTGLRILHKNVALNAAIKLSGIRNRRIPRRIVYYSRFATQLNFLRWSDRLIHPQMAGGYIGGTESQELDNVDLDNPPPMTPESSIQVSSLPPKKESEPEAEEETQAKTMTGVAPLFQDQLEYAENSYIYRHIHKRLDKYADIGNMLPNLPINSSIVQLRELVKKKNEMRILEYKASFDKIMEEISAHVKSMNQQELAILLTAIKNDDEREYRFVKKMIDIELRWLLKKHVRTRLMELDLWFYLADVFYECLVPSSFVHVLVNYLTKEKDVIMSNSQFLHLLFLVILKRNQEGILSNYEQRIQQILNKASFGDIATICLAYFKTQTPITNPEILRQVIDKTTEQLPNIDFTQPGYCAVIKSVRYSRSLECRQNVLHLMMTMVQDLNCEAIFANPFNAVHTIKMMEAYRIYDKKLLDLIVSTMFRNLNAFRIKDIQYALSSLSNFGYKIDKIGINLRKNFDMLCDEIVSEVRNDIDKQAYHLMPILRAFTIFGYYNDKLIDYVNELLLDPNKVNQMRKVLEFDRSALLVYVATRLEGHRSKLINEGNIKFLKEVSASVDRINGNSGSVRQDSSIKHLGFILRKLEHDFLVINKMFRTIATSLASSPKLQDPCYKFNFQYTMPHQNYADLIISKDCQEPGQFNAETLMPQAVPAGQTHCLLLGIRNFDYLDGHGRLCGYKKLLTRLLTKLGYTVVHVNLDAIDIESIAHRVKVLLDGGSKDS